MFRTGLALLLAGSAGAPGGAVGVPDRLILAAPFTAFNNDSAKSLNTNVIPTWASCAAKMGVNTVWIVGSMGQFPTLTITERKTVAAAWVAAGHANGLYMIVHVGTPCQADAIELAEHAASIGADAIASVPPYYDTTQSATEVVEWLRPIAAAAPQLPLYYYHIPGSTNVNIKIFDLFTAASGGVLPALTGVKYVSPDINDFMNTLATFPAAQMLWAPEPKLQSFPFGLGSGTILAEDFFAPTYLRMFDRWIAGDVAGALTEQKWKLSMSAIFSNFAGDAERAVYPQLCGFDIGPPRPPNVPISANDAAKLNAALNAAGFYNGTILGTEVLLM